MSGAASGSSRGTWWVLPLAAVSVTGLTVAASVYWSRRKQLLDRTCTAADDCVPLPGQGQGQGAGSPESSSGPNGPAEDAAPADSPEGGPAWQWQRDGVCQLAATPTWPSPEELSTWTDELLEQGIGEVTHERIGPLGPERRRVACRVENFCGDPASAEPSAAHAGWRAFVTGPLQEAVSRACGEPMVLYKEKLNLKPAGGGGGFAPHIDTPSLRAFAPTDAGPWPCEFVTAMVAIDRMGAHNGCLRIARRSPGAPLWSEEHPPRHNKGDPSGDPDSDGRAGAILGGEGLLWENLECAAGEAWVFDGWVPHRSAANMSDGPRRAIFLTYNPRTEGSVRERYYQAIGDRRKAYAAKMAVQLATAQADYQNDLAALASIPR